MLLSGPMLGLLDFRPAQILVLGLARDHDYRRFSKGVRSARGRVHRPAGGVPRCSPLLESPLDPEDIERRVAHAHNIITTSERLLLVDPAVSNIGLIIWYVAQCKTSTIPSAQLQWCGSNDSSE